MPPELVSLATMTTPSAADSDAEAAQIEATIQTNDRPRIFTVPPAGTVIYEVAESRGRRDERPRHEPLCRRPERARRRGSHRQARFAIAMASMNFAFITSKTITND